MNTTITSKGPVVARKTFLKYLSCTWFSVQEVHLGCVNFQLERELLWPGNIQFDFYSVRQEKLLVQIQMHWLLLSSLKTEKKAEFTLSIFSVYRLKTNQFIYKRTLTGKQVGELCHLHIFLWVRFPMYLIQGGLFRKSTSNEYFCV